MDSSEPQRHFSFSEGGPSHKLLLKMKVYPNKKKLLLFFFCITWLPLLILSAFEGTLLAGARPFLTDVATHVRLLVGLPMLLLIGRGIDARLIDVKRYFSETLMISDKQQLVFNKIINDSCRLAESFIAELVLILIVLGVTVGFGMGGLVAEFPGASQSWEFVTVEGKSVLSYAGRWADFISVPAFQFLALKGLWRYIVWTITLLRLSITDMSLQATHPDKAGGLGILMLAQKSFCNFFVAINIVASGELIAKLVADRASFISIRNDGLGYLGIFLVLIFLPLAFFIPKLIRIKEDGLLRLSKTGVSMSDKFERDWVNDLSIENKVAEAVVDPSTMQDYDTVFVSLEEMQFVPFTIKDLILITGMLFIPYVPILIIHFSVIGLVERLLGLLM